MKRLALVAIALLSPSAAVAQQACPCTYTLTQEQQDALVSALQAAQRWYAVLGAAGTSPRAFLLQQREVDALWHDLAAQADAKKPSAVAPEPPQK